MPQDPYRKRNERMEQTRKTADKHRQLWTAQEDEIVLERHLPADDNPADDMELAVYLGRTVTAVSQRRVVLKKLMESGMPLEEIRDTERLRRALNNNVKYNIITRRLKATCDECFSDPHLPICSKA